MTNNDIIGLVLSYVYAFGLLIIVEAIGKKAGWPQWITRKIVHIGAGMWVWGILYFFDTWYIGIIPFATFIILNYVFYRQQVFKSMDKEDSSPGTVYFAVSITILFIMFWRTGAEPDRVFIAIAAVMAMTCGDALASLLGKSYGKNHYTIFGHQRSWEGSAVMFISSFVVILLTLNYLPGSILSPLSIVFEPHSLVIKSLICAAVATVAEGISPAGTDNLTVPLLTASSVWLLI